MSFPMPYFGNFEFSGWRVENPLEVETCKETLRGVVVLPNPILKTVFVTKKITFHICDYFCNFLLLYLQFLNSYEKKPWFYFRNHRTHKEKSCLVFSCGLELMQKVHFSLSSFKIQSRWNLFFFFFKPKRGLLLPG